MIKVITTKYPLVAWGEVEVTKTYIFGIKVATKTINVTYQEP